MGTGTTFSTVAMILLGIIVKMITPFVLTVLGFPGRWMASSKAPGLRSQFGLIAGTVVTAILQSYVYLVYTVFIVQWAMFAMQKQGATYMVLFAAFFAAIFPTGAALKDARAKVEGAEHAWRDQIGESARSDAENRRRILDMMAQASSVAFLLVLTGFFIFVLFPKVMEIFCRSVTWMSGAI